MELDSALSWLALSLTPGLASRLSARLLRRFDSPEGVFRAPLPELEACNLPAAVAQAIFKKEAFKHAEKELAAVRRIAGCRLLNWTEPEYPQTLLQIYDPPVMLYVRGDPQILNLPSIGIVGTRKPTLYGTQLAERLGRDLAARGLVIVSGMARGIDAIGHQGAMAANGRAIGVLGTGIDICYPKENKKLYGKVLERGAIIGEFPLGTHPAPENFPVRNRIVAGVPLGVIIVEGAQYSGSLITARLAMEFGREVFGVPGNVTQPMSFAPNQLIKQGAKLVAGAEDVIEELPTPVRAALVQAEQPEAEQRNLLLAASLNTSEKKLYELLSAEEPRHIDDIVERSGLNSSVVLATLFDLEMKGVIRQLPGKQFSKVLL
ncbi:MAG TPA: DNA-processing protein DprA [Candidatus Acidoferrum sp.]|jgi:DNA processing protein|nr:DNA-processing protein DprA [Candidatus Acidoferrum sp.]